jgi:hypothetical protein
MKPRYMEDENMKYRKKPVVIEAHQLPSADTIGIDHEKFMNWCASVKFLPLTNWRVCREGIEIITLEDGEDGRAKHVASGGDWIIRGVQGEFYACKPDIFDATYEAVEE